MLAVIFDFELYAKGLYYVNGQTIAVFLLAFIVAILGQQLLWEKKLVPSVVLFLSFILGAFLGIGVKPLQASEIVVAGSLIVAGIFVALNIEMTLVGFAVMAIVAGFFHGHAYAVDIPDSANASTYFAITSVIVLVGMGLGLLVQRNIPKTSYLQVIGIVIGVFGALSLFF